MNAFEIDSDIPAGNIVVDRVEGDDVHLHQDLRDTRGFWFYWCFRVRGAQGRRLAFHFTNGSPVGARGAAVSRDAGVSWKWQGADAATDKSFVFAFGPEDRDVRFSLGMPYTQANWERFLASIGHHPLVRPMTLCKSRKGRVVEMAHIGQPNGKVAVRAAIACRHHCCEMMASYVLEGLLEATLFDPACRWMRENAGLMVFPFVDKDGVEDGDQGKNRAPRDHGRDYDDPQIHPETTAIRAFLPMWGAGLLRATLDLHCPGHRGNGHEHVYQVGAAQPAVWAEQQRFGAMIAACRRGPLPYDPAKDLPFGVSWNTTANGKDGVGFTRWAREIPGVRLSTGIETPYANAAGVEVNAESARAFGRDLAEALSQYLRETAVPS